MFFLQASEDSASELLDGKRRLNKLNPLLKRVARHDPFLGAKCPDQLNAVVFHCAGVSNLAEV